MKTLITAILVPLVLLILSASCWAKFDSVGFVKSVTGDAFISSAETTVRAVPNMKINQGDTVKTSERSSIGLIFEDDTVVSLGPRSEIAIDAFLFNPVEKEMSFVARMLHGTFSFISGQIAKLAPTKVKLETPDATLGVRGTKILVKVD